MNFLLLLLLSFSSFADEFVDFDTELNMAALGPEAYLCPPTTPPGYMLSAAYKKNGADCSKFINSKGELGLDGKEIFAHLEQIQNSNYLKTDYPGMKSICPQWPGFTKEQKKYFWVWFFAAIAWKESTCNSNAINKSATDGAAVGYLQLNDLKNSRSWRGGKSGDSCAVKDIKASVSNMKCGIEIFNEQLKGKNGLYEGNGQLFGKGSGSYWQDLRGNDSKIIAMVKEFPGCKSN